MIMEFWEWILWIWLVGTIVAWPITSKWFYKNEFSDDDSSGMIFGIVMGICVCWAWPFYIPGYWIYEWMREDGKTQPK